jgi:hypothetical protein
VNLILQAMAIQTGATGTKSAPQVGVSAGAYRRDDERTQHLMTTTAWVANCTSWYKAASGRVTNNWPSWTVRYWYDTLRLRPSDLGLIGPDASSPPLSHRPGRPDETGTGGESAADQSRLASATR